MASLLKLNGESAKMNNDDICLPFVSCYVYAWLKVHKRENFFASDFGFLSKLLFPMKKMMFFTKKVF